MPYDAARYSDRHDKEVDVDQVAQKVDDVEVEDDRRARLAEMRPAGLPTKWEERPRVITIGDSDALQDSGTLQDGATLQKNSNMAQKDDADRNGKDIWTDRDFDERGRQRSKAKAKRIDMTM